MRIIRILLAALVGLSTLVGPVVALDQGKFDIMVGKLEALMESRDIDADALVAALRKYGAKQTGADRRELVEALVEHFASSDRRIAWLKSQPATVRVVPTPVEREAASGAEDAKVGKSETADCMDGTHATLTGACKPDIQACYVEGGKGQTEWNADTSEWGACEIVSCGTGRSLSTDSSSCESRRFPGCDADDRLIGGIFWAMCDSTGSNYLDYYFSPEDGDAACPAGYRLPTVAEWHASYRETLGGETESDENRWKYTKKLATDLRLSARGQVYLDYGIGVLSNSFSLESPVASTPSYGDIPERERLDVKPRATRAYGDYRYLASDGLLSLYASYDPENPLSSAMIGKYAEDAGDALSRTFMPARCVRDDTN